MNKKNYNRSNDVEEKPDNRQHRPTGRNTKKYKGTQSGTRVKKRK